MKANQVRDMPVEDLKNLRFRHAIGQLENYKSLSNTKKDIARINTILREKELNINQNVRKVVKKEAKSTVKKVTKRKTKKTEETETPAVSE